MPDYREYWPPSVLPWGRFPPIRKDECIAVRRSGVVASPLGEQKRSCGANAESVSSSDDDGTTDCG